MIKANELRIGNLVIYNGEIKEILGISILAIYVRIKFDEELSEIKYQSLEPIRLTPEILEKCGFVKGERSVLRKGSLHLMFFDGGFYCAVVDNEIKYLHQLQNLYFALTWEELEINL